MDIDVIDFTELNTAFTISNVKILCKIHQIHKNNLCNLGLELNVIRNWMS